MDLLWDSRHGCRGHRLGTHHHVVHVAVDGVEDGGEAGERGGERLLLREGGGGGAGQEQVRCAGVAGLRMSGF